MVIGSNRSTHAPKSAFCLSPCGVKYSAAAWRIAQHIEAGFSVVGVTHSPMTTGGRFECDRRADIRCNLAERVIDLAVSDGGGGHHSTSSQ
jgi:hypothetical protein